MSNIIQITSLNEKKVRNLYAQAMERRSAKNGIDYRKLYTGSFEEKAKERMIQENNYKKQSLEAWSVEG